MDAKMQPPRVDFEEVGDVLEGLEVADDRLAQINSRVARLLADDDVLREVRSMLGVPQKDVASELGVTASAIAQLESRSLEAVQLGTLRRYFDSLALKMKVTVEPASPVGTTSAG
jgi:DNA-binding XRE family transcriptional regulator